MLRALVFFGTFGVSLLKDMVSKKDADPDEASAASKTDAAKKKDKPTEKAMPMDKEAMKAAAWEQIKKNAIPSFLLVVTFLTCLLIVFGEGIADRDDKPKPA